MELLKNWIFSVCGASMVSSIIKIIFKGSKVSKSVNIFLSLFLMFYMISPFDTKTDYYWKTGTNKDISYNNYSYSEFIEVAINDVCQEEGCEILSLKIDEDNKNDEVVINSVDLTIDDKDKCSSIKDKIMSKFGFEVYVS